MPLFTGVIGYITNWTGVLMLFKPIGFHGVHVPGLKVLFPILPRRVQVLPLIRYDGGLGWQGIVPSRADKMASIAVDKGLAKLGNIGDFYRELEPDRIAEHLGRDAQASRSATSSSRSWTASTRSCGATCRRWSVKRCTRGCASSCRASSSASPTTSARTSTSSSTRS